MQETHINTKAKEILVLGGGFGGVRTALDLWRAHLPDVKITLVSQYPHLEYHPTLYRVVTGRSPLQVCIPLAEIFAKTGVEVLLDKVTAVDLTSRRVDGASGARYSYDWLIAALGSETSYFGVPGLQELAYGFKSITEAMTLQKHLHGLFETSKPKPVNIVVIGGGASGVELSGELAVYVRGLARKHGYDLSLVNIELIEAAPRLLPALPNEVAERVQERLQKLGVNVFLSRQVVKEDLDELYTGDMELKTNTVVWTAGVKPNGLYQKIAGLQFDKKGLVLVDEHLQVPGYPGVFVIGDAAVSLYSGMAQTAAHQGGYAAEAIVADARGRKCPPYHPKKPGYAIPVGPGWAAAIVGPLRLYWRLGWLGRKFADYRYFLSILSWRRAWAAFSSERTLSESCLICMPEGGEAK